MEQLKTFKNAVLAGICIGIAATVFLSVNNPVIGSLFFSTGLFTIIVNKLELYTGRVGYLINPYRQSYFSELRNLIIIWFGNLLGVFAVTQLLTHTRIRGKIISNAIILFQTKSADTLLSLFILSIFCGILMFVAVEAYKNSENILTKNIMVFLSVSVFILSGFEHSIADMYYYIIGIMYHASDISIYQNIIQIMIITIGNAFGAIGFNYLKQKHHIRKD